MSRGEKTKRIAELLTQNYYTIGELAELTGTSKNTVRIQLSLHLPKKGFRLLTREETAKNGQKAFKIEKVE